ncbi:hypothetical protein ACOCJ7_06930 [Knoellia sp. CPCC 206453]|uniref:hypothetical protein n=1 Tax=Knoellia pratensis TaxID=3404796 RepID=UPI003612C477
MARHTTRRLTSAAFGLALAGASGIAFAGTASADPNPNITICHATGSETNPFVVITIDAAAITQQGHDTHQNDNDVIPPFTYVRESDGETVTFDGQNWHENWMTNGEGVALEDVDKADCGEPANPTPSKTPTSTVTVTSTPSGPTGPVVETDLVDSSGPNPALLGGGAALVLAGAAAATAATRRRGSHS